MTTSEFFANGWDAASAGDQENPYPASTAAHDEWESGHFAAREYFGALADYAAEAQAEDEQAHWEEDPEYRALNLPEAEFAAAWEEDAENYPDEQFSDYWLDQQIDDYTFNPVEQGMYDDDPSPYNGDYSEM